MKSKKLSARAQILHLMLMPDATLARQKRLTLLICVGLAVATALAYWRVAGFEFTSYDDPDFVTSNLHTQAGLTGQTIAWTFHAEVARNWHPLTLLTHALDCQLFGLRPGPPHVVNLLWHIANTLLLFSVVKRMTGAIWPSAAVAAFFALHPLHVESVAWIAERKDVLSAFFWLLTMWAYLRYAENTGAKRYYFLALLFFAFGLMCKPMVVTLPFVLWLFDFWPLRRWKSQRARVIVEKIPFLALSAADCVVTWMIQQHGGSMLGAGDLPWRARIDNAIVSCVLYLGKMVYPHHLAALYLRHGDWPLWQVAPAGLFLVVMTGAVIWQARKRPYLAFGWFWYLGTLIPVIGLVQVGMQSMADRYTYIPLIGIFLMIALIIAEWRLSPKLMGGVTSVLLGLCLYLTGRQTLYWKDSETLFRRMIAVTDRNYMAHYDLGNLYAREKKMDDAMAQYREALRDEPNYADAANNLGGLLLDQKRYDEAIGFYADAVRIHTDFTHSFNLANALADAASARHDANLFAKAVEAYGQALALNPASAEAHHNFGLTWAAQGKPAEAIAEYEEAARLQPDFEPAQFDLAEALSHANRMDEAQAHYLAAERLNPSRAETHDGLGLCYAMKGDMTNSAAELKEAVRLQPSYATAWGNLGNALAAQNKFDEAIPAYEAALKLNPSDYQSEFNLGLTFYRQGKNAEARGHLRAALQINPSYGAARQALQQIP